MELLAFQHVYERLVEGRRNPAMDSGSFQKVLVDSVSSAHSRCRFPRGRSL